MEHCPVCGRPVYERNKRITMRHNGVQYFFDSLEHREEFEESPGMYTGKQQANPGNG